MANAQQHCDVGGQLKISEPSKAEFKTPEIRIPESSKLEPSNPQNKNPRTLEIRTPELSKLGSRNSDILTHIK